MRRFRGEYHLSRTPRRSLPKERDIWRRVDQVRAARLRRSALWWCHYIAVGEQECLAGWGIWQFLCRLPAGRAMAAHGIYKLH